MNSASNDHFKISTCSETRRHCGFVVGNGNLPPLDRRLSSQLPVRLHRQSLNSQELRAQTLATIEAALAVIDGMEREVQEASPSTIVTPVEGNTRRQ